MKTTATLAGFVAAAVALTPGTQFVLYAQGDDEYSQRADPIITPGKLSGHVHDFAGSSSFAPELSYEALQNTECTTVGSNDMEAGGFSKDHSVYWHPALYAKANDGSGYIKVPTSLHKMYYRVPGGKLASPFEFPKGWRALAGDPFLREPSNTTGITHWQCMGPNTVGEDGGFPVFNKDTPCDVYSGLVAKVHFPNCWDGKDPGDREPSEYAAYPVDGASGSQCPSTHPFGVPHIEFENLFDVASVWDKIDIATFTLAQGDETGFGMHGDFFNGWESGIIAPTVESCPYMVDGNQNVGDCSGFIPNNTPRKDCKLKTYFKEDIAAPGQALVGCNPVTNALTKVAKMFKVAPLGSVTTSCDPLGDSSSSSDDSDDAPAYSAPSYSAPSSAGDVMSILPVYSNAPSPSTTLAVSTTAAAAPSITYAPPPGGWDSIDYNVAAAADDDEDDDEDTEWVYETVWATETATAQVYARDNSHRHQHMHAHRRRNF